MSQIVFLMAMASTAGVYGTASPCATGRCPYATPAYTVAPRVQAMAPAPVYAPRPLYQTYPTPAPTYYQRYYSYPVAPTASPCANGTCPIR